MVATDTDGRAMKPGPRYIDLGRHPSSLPRLVKRKKCVWVDDVRHSRSRQGSTFNVRVRAKDRFTSDETVFDAR